jgi:hypothetical protein
MIFRFNQNRSYISFKNKSLTYFYKNYEIYGVFILLILIMFIFFKNILYLVEKLNIFV